MLISASDSVVGVETELMRGWSALSIYIYHMPSSAQQNADATTMQFYQLHSLTKHM
jgi:hypothetical protein